MPRGRNAEVSGATSLACSHLRQWKAGGSADAEVVQILALIGDVIAQIREKYRTEDVGSQWGHMYGIAEHCLRVGMMK